MKTTFLYTTMATESDAKKIAANLLEQKLIVCASWWQVQSMYVWEGKLEDTFEWIMLCKTTIEQSGDAFKALEEIHPYQCPVISTWNTDKTNDRYVGWAKEMLPE